VVSIASIVEAPMRALNLRSTTLRPDNHLTCNRSHPDNSFEQAQADERRWTHYPQSNYA
jgi:hypothetical protein